MDETTKACPAEEPVQASALCDDSDIDPDIAEARKRAGIALRKLTVASTMIYAGSGLRASERAKITKATPEDHSEVEATSVTASETAPKRRRVRTPMQLISRLVDAIEGQLDQIDAIMRDPDRSDSGASEAERHARTVAALARVTVELRKELEAGRRRRADDDSSSGRIHAVDPDRPRDLDELRERLSRRLDARLTSGPAVSVGDDAAGGDRIPE